ncbi:synaptotagmin-15-like [Limulus polyphemus]|uniref:Synaptotagmin-15-like n=1 Tax=Limulus polyphemus TaxID=6850 RepID=A0ABM1BDR9_LIMPO|nr:synaptotagmin-15-like [Limulus polyphemus]
MKQIVVMQSTIVRPETLKGWSELRPEPTNSAIKRRLKGTVRPQEHADPLKEQESFDTNVQFYRDPILLTIVAVGVVAIVFVIIGFGLYRQRKRQKSYEEFGRDSTTEYYSKRSTDSSVYGGITQEKPVDFIHSAMPLTVLQSPDETSLSSGSSPDAIMWSRLTLIDNGTLDLSESSLFDELNPDLYKVDQDDSGEEFIFPVGHRGRIWFSLEFDAVKERLIVHLIKGKNFPSRTLGSVSCCDPFMRIFLLPDETCHLQTKVLKKTCNPKFEEWFVFQIPGKAIEERTLKFSAFDSNRGKRHSFIGHVVYPLKCSDFTTNGNLIIWRDLEKNADEVSSDLGELLVSLIYSQTLERLTVTIHEAQGLQLPEDSCFIDSYVKLKLLVDNKPVKRKKSVMVKKTTEPKYNETFIFRLAPNCVNTASLLLQVMMANGNSKDKCLGRIILGSYMFGRAKTEEHWNEEVSEKYHQVRYWHKLT